MFTYPRPNVYESSEGFTVEVVGFSEIRYREGAKQVTVGSELLAEPGLFAVYGSTIRRWEPPYDADVISEKERARIVDNIRRALASRGLRIEAD